jgi:hypothetical protein
MFPMSDPRLGEVLRRLVEAYQPIQVYLFGSHARGEAGPDSDYDLLLVVPDDASPERRRSRLAYERLWGTSGERVQQQTSSSGPKARSGPGPTSRPPYPPPSCVKGG